MGGGCIWPNVRAPRWWCHPYVAAFMGMLPAIAGAACDWSRPGSAPYRAAGDVTAASAVESYTDIPTVVRAELARRIRGQREDALLLIGRDSITSPAGTATRLRDMHWRDGLCRGEVQRTGWAPGRVEAALLYCASGHCVAVPTICGNVARVDFVPHERARQALAARQQPTHHVPEPGTLLLAVAGLAAMGAAAQRARGVDGP